MLTASFITLQAQYGLLQQHPLETQWYENESLHRDSAYLHSAIRPWHRTSVERFSRRADLLQDSITTTNKFWNWAGRKLWQENLVKLEGKNYTLTFDPVLVVAAGQDQASEGDYTFQNSRGFRLELALGEKLTAYSTFVETQARLPQHLEAFTAQNRVVPGFWRTKNEPNNVFDFAYVAGEVGYTPNEIFHFRLGHGKQFIGEGYRSMLISDNAVNYPFFRIETQFGPIKYINTWAIMNDIRSSVMVGDIFAKKYLSMHYLSINFSKRFNLGFFEGNMWGDELNEFGFDFNFLNPVIFFRPVEFAQGSDGGNSIIGINTSYLFDGGIQVYGQLVIDDFKFEDFQNWSEGSWLNLYAWQLGVKYGDALGVKNLFLRLEYNAARPYMYSHRKILTNWAHYNQALAHPWGGNFEEFLAQAQYRYGRWYFEGAIHIGRLGRDIGNENYGGDIYQSYEDRVADTDVFIVHGAASELTYWRAEVSYIFNPISNLRLLAGYRSREETVIENGLPDSRAWYVGVGTNLYRGYDDF
ncbi:MAG: capsule assembly Wzi family protein [Bacteroidota bacterium]